jgi:hypothetical protein
MMDTPITPNDKMFIVFKKGTALSGPVLLDVRFAERYAKGEDLIKRFSEVKGIPESVLFLLELPFVATEYNEIRKQINQPIRHS